MSGAFPYQSRREIARGGMGAVLDALDEKLGRSVAMKVMLNQHADAEEKYRFLLEARVLGQLPHPNIVPVHDVGTDNDGRAYYTMKLVQGSTLHEIVKRLKAGDEPAVAAYPLATLLTIFHKTCDAIAFAHSRGIIHRDLKPQNIMVGEFGEVQVMDWGIAKILPGSPAAAIANTPVTAGAVDPEEPSTATIPPASTGVTQSIVDSGLETVVESGGAAENLDATVVDDGPALAFRPTDTEPLRIDDLYATMEGAIMGTPYFMSPEQAEGHISELDGRSDIYSLGGILYQLLTLRLPIEGRSQAEILSKVRSGMIRPPTEFNPAGPATGRSSRPNGGEAENTAGAEAPIRLRHCPGGRVPDALGAVAMKALAHDRARRYQEVGELSRDIEAYQGGFATSAESASMLRLIRLFIHRNRVLTAALSIIAILTVTFMAKVVASERKARESAEQAETERVAAVAAREDAESERVRADQNAREAQAAEQAARAALGEARTEKARADEKAREAESNRLQAVAAAELARQQETLAKAAADEARRSEKSAREANSVAQMQRARADEKALEARTALEAANVQRHRAEAGEREQLRNLFESYLSQGILHAENGDYAAARGALEQARSTAAADADVITAGRRSLRNVVAWLTEISGKSAATVLRGAGAPLKCVAAVPDGRRVVAGGEDGTLYVFAADASPPFTFKAHTDLVTRVLVFADGNHVASAGADRMVRIFRFVEGELKPVQQWRAGAPVAALAASPDGRLLAVGNDEGDLTILNAVEGVPLEEIAAAPAAISDVAFSADGERLGAVSFDRRARIWRRGARGRFREEFATPAAEGQLVCLALDHGGGRLATAGIDGVIRLWNVKARSAGHRLAGHDNTITALAFGKEGKDLVSSSLDRTIRVWDVASGVRTRVLQGHETGVTAMHRNGDRLFSAGNDQTVRLWAVGGGREDDGMRIVETGAHIPNAVAVSPNLKLLAVGYADGRLEMRSLPDATSLWSLPAHATNVTRIAFAPDGSSLVSASFDGGLKQWSTDAGEPRLLRAFSKQVDVVNDLAFTPNGRFLAAASIGSRVRVTEEAIALNENRSGGRITMTDLTTGEARGYAAHKGEVLAVAFNDDGSRLASTGDDGATMLWQQQAGGLVKTATLPADRDMGYAIAFQPRGGQIATAGRSGTLRILDTATSSEVAALAGHENAIMRLAYAPDGGQVFTVGADGTLRCWDVAMDRSVFTLRLPVARSGPAPLWDFAFRYQQGAGGWMAVPLTDGKVVLLRLGALFDRDFKTP